jgi:hypothetical protein
MRDAVRFTVSVPSDLLDAVDQKLMKSEASRSALVRRLLERALREAEEQEQIESYVRGYRDKPQTEKEKDWLGSRINRLAPDRMREVDRAIHFALGLAFPKTAGCQIPYCFLTLI